MSGNGDELKTAVRLWCEERGATGEHPTPGELGAYHAGHQSPEAEERTQAHLVVCQECAGLLLDLAAFPALREADVEEPHIPQAEMAAAWEELRMRVGVEREETPAPTAGIQGLEAARQKRQKVPNWNSLFISYAVAASLLLAAVIMGVWLVSLRRENQQLVTQAQELERREKDLSGQLSQQSQATDSAGKSLASARQEIETQRQESARAAAKYETEIAELRRPAPRRDMGGGFSDGGAIVNVPTAELYPDETVRGAGAEVKSITLPPRARLFTLTLNTADAVANATYTLDILDARGRKIWTGRGLRKNENNALTVALPARALPGGGYRLRLSRGGTPLEQFSFRVLAL